MNARLVLLTALSMAFGWRIRGQFGHEIGAALPGALAAIAIALLAGGGLWRPRVHYFAFLGALGWAFGGSMSYMKVIGYSHSSDSATVLYGFAGIFFLGFLWAALGGAGTALSAVLSADRLAGLFPAVAAVFAGWFVQDIVVDWTRFRAATDRTLGARVADADGLARFDADWLAATVALVAVLVLALARRKIDFGTSLVLHLAIGWWAAFATLVLALGWRLNPPRGDNWAGCVGLVAGLLVFCRRHQLASVATAAVTAGWLGGTGFCLGQMIKLVFISTGIQWGWHAVMEWIHGLFFGVALVVALAGLGGHTPEPEERPLARWTGIFSILFVLWVIPYLNFRRSPAGWLKAVASLPSEVCGVAVVSNLAPSRGWIGWFDSAFLLAGAALTVLLVRHARQSLAVIPESWLGRGQLLHLTLLWIAAGISFAHEIPTFNPATLVINWAITVNAVLCTWLLLSAPPVPGNAAAAQDRLVGGKPLRRAVAWVLAAGLVSSVSGWGLKRALFGDRFTGYFYMDHIRFGPEQTNDRQ